MFKRSLVFAAHIDDELTMAGTIAQFTSGGGDVLVVTMTDGCEGYPTPDLKDKIVAMRKDEARETDRVLGIGRRVFLDRPDMGLAYDKSVLQECIRIIREFQPEAIFTHGPADRHCDHRATHRISVDAWWHAGEPVAASLGTQWRTPILLYYKGVASPDALPLIRNEVTKTAHKRFEALAAQVSQHVLFKSTREELLAKAEKMKASQETTYETFWIAEVNRFDSFPILHPV